MEARKEAINRFQYLCEDTDVQDRMERYNAVAHVYDKDSNVLEWIGPKIAAKAVKNIFNDNKIRILDVCAGTGAVAIELKQFGFDNVDFLDGSEEMIKIAMDRKLYASYICQIIVDGVPTLLRDGLYDAVIMSGGHVTPAKCAEMLRLTTTNGYCFLVVFLEGEYDEREYAETLDHIKMSESSKKCKLISADRIEQVSLDDAGNAVPGALIVWQKL